MLKFFKALTILTPLLFLFFCSCKKNITTPEIGLFGFLTDIQGCKSFESDARTESDSPNNRVECIQYDYDGEGLLILKHINAGFNCCPGKIEPTISATGNLISIEEKEQEQGCFCRCLFDLTYQFTGVAPGEYTLEVKGPYIKDTDEKLIFNLSLYGPCNGTFCVNRTHYPWDGSSS
ncbi:MAG: hypothetical protein PVF22_05785 [Candidatus Aminicenantes bacterium]